jgi:hypothetical protein
MFRPSPAKPGPTSGTRTICCTTRHHHQLAFTTLHRLLRPSLCLRLHHQLRPAPRRPTRAWPARRRSTTTCSPHRHRRRHQPRWTTTARPQRRHQRQLKQRPSWRTSESTWTRRRRHEARSRRKSSCNPMARLSLLPRQRLYQRASATGTRYDILSTVYHVC